MGILCGKIVLTGGPCAGKTSALVKLEEELKELGYHVLIINESATELIKGGIKPFGENKIDIVEYQKLIFLYQLMKENTYQKAVELLPDNTKCFIICDRGIFDNQAYITKKQFQEIVKENGYDEISLLDRYDIVFHLVTAADGKEEYYTLENNNARTETIEEARALDKKTMNAWIGHNYLQIIDNQQDFTDKLEKVRTSVLQFLGNPVPIRRQKKYLIDLFNSNLAFLSKIAHTTTKIEQYYLTQDNTFDYETRLRKKSYNDGTSYYYTVQKKEQHGNQKIITDEKITEEQFQKLLSNSQLLSKIEKTRITFVYDKQYFRLDIFDNNYQFAILEIETTKEHQRIDIPKFLPPIREVTDESKFYNINLAIPIKKNKCLKKKK